MPIDNVTWYSRIGVYYSISPNSLCNYTHNFKIRFLNKNYAIPLIVFCQYFLLWISFHGKFLWNSYLFLNSGTCLCAKNFYRCFYWRLTAVIYRFKQRFYCKLITLALIMLLIIFSGDIKLNQVPKRILKFPFVNGI